MAKTRRRRCDYCGNQYRYSRSTSKTCSPAHRQALYEQRKAEEAESEQPQMETSRHGPGRYVQLAGQFRQQPPKPSTKPVMTHEEELDELMKIVLPDGPPRVKARPAPPPTPVHVTIKNVPTRFPGTPLNRGNTA